MAERTEKLILIPRYSTFAGAGDYWMKPIPARRYATAIVAAWRSAGVGASVLASVAIEQSTDLQNWYSCGSSLSPSAGSETDGSFDFTADWFRVKVTIGGTDPLVTLWSVGDFVVREGA